MTIVRAIDDDDHDWLFGKGKNDYKPGQASVAQDLQTRLSMFLADCFFDLGAGVDWFNLLGQKDQAAIKLAITTCILNTNFVVSLENLDVKLDANRNFTVTYAITTVFSTLTQAYTFNPGSIGHLATEQGGLLGV